MLESSIELTAKQDTAFERLTDNKTTEVLFGGGAGGGKSAFGCLWLIYCCENYPNTRWLMGRAELKILKETTLNTFFEICTRLKIQSGRHYEYRQQAGIIKWHNGSEILLKDLKYYPADPNFDTLGSLEISGGFIDEVAEILEKAWLIVKSRIRYKLDEYGLIPKLLGTCNPNKGFSYSRFFKPHRENTLPEDRAFIQSLLHDNPHVSKHYRANLESLDRASRERLLNGNWNYDNDPSTLIEYDAIVDLWRGDIATTAPTNITADIARYGSDSTKIAVWSNWTVVKWVVLPKSSVTESAQLIAALMEQYNIPRSRVVVDEDGVGGGVVDILKCNGFVNNARPMEERVPLRGMDTPNYNNLKSQCYFRLADRINRRAVKILPDIMTTEEVESLTAELEQVKQKDMDKDGKRQVVPKDAVKEILGRSPDGSDTLMMREYFELKPKTTFRAF